MTRCRNDLELPVAGGHGLCLMAEAATLRTAFKVQIFDADFNVQHSVSLGGLLSRARVSPDGRYGSVTAFLSGHSYATNGQFSTSTTLLDLTTGRKLYDLEKLAITKNGKPFRAVDFQLVGDYAGFPVFARQGIKEDVIYIPSRAGLVAPYRKK